VHDGIENRPSTNDDISMNMRDIIENSKTINKITLRSIDSYKNIASNSFFASKPLRSTCVSFLKGIFLGQVAIVTVRWF